MELDWSRPVGSKEIEIEIEFEFEFESISINIQLFAPGGVEAVPGREPETGASSEPLSLGSVSLSTAG